MGARVILAVLVAALLGAPAAASAGPTGTGANSRGVEHLTTLPAPAAVSANFKTVGDKTYMFVSALSGLYVYDITDPGAPLPAGALPLPHFQNEDVSLAGDRLLISTDASGGGGLLIAVNIADPTVPKVERVVKMETLGEGHTASCIDDRCRWVWVAGDQLKSAITVLDLDKAPQAGAADLDGRADLVQLFDFLDLVPDDQATPKPDVLVGEFGGYPEFALVTHDVHVDSKGVAWVAGGGGTIGFDVSNYGAEGTDPLRPPVVARTGEAAANDGDILEGPLISLLTGQAPDPSQSEDTVNDFIHHNALRPDGGDVALITEEDLYNRWTTGTPGGCETQGSFQTWQIGADGGAMTNLDSWTTEYNEFLASEDQDPVAGVDMVPTMGLCSAHYFDERDGLVAIGWYEQGMRLLDVSSPGRIKQVGYWIPPGDATWSAYWSPAPGGEDILYVLNNKRGVEVLRVGAGTGSRSVTAPIDAITQNAQRSNARPHPALGWMCRIAA